MPTATPTAISDVNTFLYAETTTAGTYAKLIDITSAPATGSAPKTLDTTTLSDAYSTSIPDRPETPSYEFEYKYTGANFTTVTAAISLTTDKNYLIVYQDGSGEKFTGRGSTWKKEVGVGKVVMAGLAFAVSSHEHVADTASLTGGGT